MSFFKTLDKMIRASNQKAIDKFCDTTPPPRCCKNCGYLIYMGINYDWHYYCKKHDFYYNIDDVDNKGLLKSNCCNEYYRR